MLDALHLAHHKLQISPADSWDGSQHLNRRRVFDPASYPLFTLTRPFECSCDLIGFVVIQFEIR